MIVELIKVVVVEREWQSLRDWELSRCRGLLIALVLFFDFVEFGRALGWKFSAEVLCVFLCRSFP